MAVAGLHAEKGTACEGEGKESTSSGRSGEMLGPRWSDGYASAEQSWRSGRVASKRKKRGRRIGEMEGSGTEAGFVLFGVPDTMRSGNGTDVTAAHSKEEPDAPFCLSEKQRMVNSGD